MTHGKLSVALAACFVSAVSCGPARADPPEIVDYGSSRVSGGPGGGPFRHFCKTSQYVTGLLVSSGDNIDSNAAFCSFLSPDKTVFYRGVPDQTDKAGGNGGGERAARCAPNQYVSGLKYGFTRDGNQPKFLDYVEITCQPLQPTGNASTVCLGTNDNGCWDRYPSPGPYNGYGLAFSANCRYTNFMIGLIGRSGQYVDALGIECLPRPR